MLGMFWRLIILALVLLLSLGLNVCLGEITLSPLQAWLALTDPHAVQSGIVDMLWQIRLPRLLTALTVGLGLSLSGYLLQAISRNYLADPYLTGVSSGAGLAVTMAMITGCDFALLPAAAFVGGLCASLVVAFMARSSPGSAIGFSVTKLLLAGVAISAICGSLITLILTLSGNIAKVQGIFFWLAGGISGASWNVLEAAFAYVAIGFAIALAMSKSLRLLSLGPQQAAALGLNVPLTQWVLLVTAVLVCGAAVSVSGLVGFVGLIAPYISRHLFGRDERLHLVACLLVGGILVLLSDLAARTLGQGQELPLGTLLALVGAPFFLYLVLKQKGEAL
jgi:iron complex transport system permease protein